MNARILLLGWAGSPSQQHGRLLPTQEAPQLAQHADQAVAVVAAGLDMEGEPAAATIGAKAQRGGDRGTLPAAPMDQHRSLAAGAQLERTIGVSETPDSSKKQLTALPRLAVF